MESSPAAIASSPPDRGRFPYLRLFAFLAIVVAGVAADLFSKSYFFSRLGIEGGQVLWVLPPVFGFQTSLNEGALFGMGQGLAPVFAVLSVAAAVGIVYWLFVVRAASELDLLIALAMITAGILGNLYDRLGLHGLRWPHDFPNAGQTAYAVRDFILVMIGSFHWPNFNLADSLLVCGAGVLLWHASRTSPRTSAAAATHTSPSSLGEGS